MTSHLAASLLVLQQNKNKAEELAHYLTDPAKMVWGSRSGHYKTLTLTLLSWILPLTLTLLSWILPLTLTLLSWILPLILTLLSWILPLTLTLLSWILPLTLTLLSWILPLTLTLLSWILPLTLTLLSWILPLTFTLLSWILPLTLTLQSWILPLTLTLQSWILLVSLAHAAAAAATMAHYWPLPHRLEEALDAAQTKLPAHDRQGAQLLVGGGVGRGQGGDVDGVANGLVARGVDHVA